MNPTPPQGRFTSLASSREKAPQVGFPVLGLQVLGTYFIFSRRFFFMIYYFLWELLHLVTLPKHKLFKGRDYVLVIDF